MWEEREDATQSVSTGPRRDESVHVASAGGSGASAVWMANLIIDFQYSSSNSLKSLKHPPKIPTEPASVEETMQHLPELRSEESELIRFSKDTTVALRQK